MGKYQADLWVSGGFGAGAAGGRRSVRTFADPFRGGPKSWEFALVGGRLGLGGLPGS